MIKAFFKALAQTVRAWVLNRVADAMDFVAVRLLRASTKVSDAADAVRAKA